MLTDITFFGKAAALRNAQLELLSANLANASTPHYKAVNLDFRKALNVARGMPGNGIGDPLAFTRYERGLQAGLDGNSVDPQQTLMQMTRTALYSEADMQFASGGIQAMLDAIKTANQG